MRIPNLSILLRDRQGNGAIELAAILPVLFLLFAGMVDVSRFVAARIDAEQAAQRATDYALAYRPNGDNGEYIAAEAANAAGVPAEDVTVEIFLECDGTLQDDFYTSCDPGEDQARLVNVIVERGSDMIFNWGALAGLFDAQAMGSSITVQGDSLVRFQ